MYGAILSWMALLNEQVAALVRSYAVLEGETFHGWWRKLISWGSWMKLDEADLGCLQLEN